MQIKRAKSFQTKEVNRMKCKIDHPVKLIYEPPEKGQKCKRNVKHLFQLHAKWHISILKLKDSLNAKAKKKKFCTPRPLKVKTVFNFRAWKCKTLKKF